MAQRIALLRISSWLLHVSYMLAYRTHTSCFRQGDNIHNNIYISPVPPSSEWFHLLGTRDMSLSSKPFLHRVETFSAAFRFACATPSMGARLMEGSYCYAAESFFCYLLLRRPLTDGRIQKTFHKHTTLARRWHIF